MADRSQSTSSIKVTPGMTTKATVPACVLLLVCFGTALGGAGSWIAALRFLKRL